MYFVMKSEVNKNTLGVFILLFIFVPVVVVVVCVLHYVRTWMNRPLGEVESGVASAVILEDYMTKLADVGLLERAHGMVHITSIESEKLLEMLGVLTGEATRDHSKHSADRLWQRDAFITPRPEGLPSGRDERVLRWKFIEWCATTNTSHEVSKLFGDRKRVPVADVAAHFQGKEMSKELSFFAAHLLDIYETGFVSPEAFTTYINTQKSLPLGECPEEATAVPEPQVIIKEVAVEPVVEKAKEDFAFV